MSTATFRFRALGAACLLTLSALAPHAAAQCVATSGAQRVALLELYTSEGCSSCPPADKWLRSLSARKFVPSALLPLAFHVDYWNDLGWTDPFSQAKFSDRQRQHSRRRGASFVVTPQLLLNGQSYQRPLLLDDIDGKTKAINQAPARAEIRLTQVRTPRQIDAHVDVRVNGDADALQAQLFLAVYENNLQTAVPAGENKGALLQHDFVVRTLSNPVAFGNGGRLSHDASIEIDSRWKAGDLHLAAFVQHPRTGEVLQAISAFCR